MTEAEYSKRLAELEATHAKNVQYLDREQALIRDLSWVDGPLIPVAGKRIRHMTIHDYLSLSVHRNAFLIGGTIWPEDVFDFLWQLNPRRTRGPLRRLRRYWYCRRVKIGIAEATKEIQDYLADTLLDVPHFAKKQSDATPRRIPISWVVNMIHTVAAEYGQDPDEMKHKPLCRVLQLYHRIVSGNDAKLVHLSREHMKLNAEHLDRVNALNAEREKAG